MTWQEALDYMAELNARRLFGFSGWRLPNRRELFSLVSQKCINPALPSEHPFVNVFNGYYWTGTTCSRLTDQAWYVHLGGARVFKGMKHGSYMVWPVRTHSGSGSHVPRTGQSVCYSEKGKIISCAGSGQDGEMRAGSSWPQTRFTGDGSTIKDRLTGLIWHCSTDLAGEGMSWEEAREAVQSANRRNLHGYSDWRLPEIDELESLCDMANHTPALPAAHPFTHVRPYYWSGTTSRYDPDYAWVLYLEDGAVGVGFKPLSEFFVWLARGHRLNL